MNNDSIHPRRRATSKQALQTTEKIDRIQRRAYLKKSGITGEQYQLDLLFPATISRNDLRHIPNDYARSSLFTARSKTLERRTLTRETLFHYNEHITILYTGIELRAEDDELVWLQILNFGRNVPLGQPFEFRIVDLVREVGWSKNGRNYHRARQCITRLKANEVLALNSKAYGSSGAISLIQNYVVVNNGLGEPTDYRVWIDPNLVLLFAGNTFTCHAWGVYRKLTPVARRLVDYIESHRHPFPLAVSKLHSICSSADANATSWRQTVRRACAEIMEYNIARVAVLKEDFIYCYRD